MLTEPTAGIPLRRMLMSGVLVLLVAAVITLGWLFAIRSEDFQYHLHNDDDLGGGGGGGGGVGGGGGGEEWWARTSRLTEDQCRACEAALEYVCDLYMDIQEEYF